MDRFIGGPRTRSVVGVRAPGVSVFGLPEIMLFSVSFCPPKSIINSFLRVQFSRLLSSNKEKNIISCFRVNYNTPQVEFLLLTFFKILARHLFNFK